MWQILSHKVIYDKEPSVAFKKWNTTNLQSDIDFADNIVLLLNEIQQTRELLKLFETEAVKIGHQRGDDIQPGPPAKMMTSINGGKIKKVKSFKYLGGWMESSERDIVSTCLGSLS